MAIDWQSTLYGPRLVTVFDSRDWSRSADPGGRRRDVDRHWRSHPHIQWKTRAYLRPSETQRHQHENRFSESPSFRIHKPRTRIRSQVHCHSSAPGPARFKLCPGREVRVHWPSGPGPWSQERRLVTGPADCRCERALWLAGQDSVSMRPGQRGPAGEARGCQSEGCTTAMNLLVM
jgi:hypothetical protein